MAVFQVALAAPHGSGLPPTKNPPATALDCGALLLSAVCTIPGVLQVLIDPDRCAKVGGTLEYMPSETATEQLVARYLRSWQEGDLPALRACLADEIRFDWGIETYTDPDVFVAASASGIEWRDVVVLRAMYGPNDASVIYEGINVTDGVRVRTAEYLVLGGGVIREAVVVFADLGDAD